MRKVFYLLLALLIIIQFFGIDRSNPPVEPEADFLAQYEAPAELGQQIVAACYDCHSHQTYYPWYTRVAPVSWWIKGHINQGREALNFSRWSNYDPDRQAHKLEEAAEEVEQGHMPLPSYLWLHPEAQLSEADRQAMTAWFTGLLDQFQLSSAGPQRRIQE